MAEHDEAFSALAHTPHARVATKKVPVLGIGGTVGAGKSSLADELIRRQRLNQGDSLRVAVRFWATAFA